MNKLIFSLPLIASLTSFSSVAAIIEYNFEGEYIDGSVHDSMVFTHNSVDVEVSAWRVDNDGNGLINSWNRISGDNTGVYYKHDDDLGVKSSAGDGYNIDGSNYLDDPNAEDAYDYDEGLMFSFEEEMRLDFIDFDSWGEDHSFNLTVDGVTILVDIFSGVSNPLVYSGTGNDDDYFYFSDITGYDFFFWSDDDNSSFRVDDLQVSTVPEPNMIGLLFLGLTGMFLARKKV